MNHFSCFSNPVQSGLIRKVCVAILLALPLSSGQAAAAEPAGIAPPAPPQQWVDTSWPEGLTGRVISVKDGEDLQAALDKVAPGQVLQLEAGATFVGNFVLRQKKKGDAWILITTSAHDKLPQPGERITPNHSDLLAKIVSPNDQPAITTEFGAHHYRLTGLEISTTSASSYNLVLLGYQGLRTGEPAKRLEDLPSHIIFDRLYIHGQPQQTVRRGILLDARHVAVLDCHIDEIHEAENDSQALACFNGAGPFKITNNYLSGAGENVLFGGMDPTIPELVPADIEFRHNYCFKPLAWKTGEADYNQSNWSIKNSFELKNARRALIADNIFENNWLQSQDGTAILFTVRNQYGKAPWSTVEDIEFTRNWVRNTDNGFLLLGMDTTTGVPSRPMQRIHIHNNLLTDVRRTFFSLITSQAPMLDIQIAFNTGVHTAAGNNALFIEDSQPPLVADRIAVVNNVLSHGVYGVAGSGQAPGKATLDHFLQNCTFTHNVLIGVERNHAAHYPAGNHHPTSWEKVGCVDLASKNYALARTSQFQNAATDGSAPGVRFAETSPPWSAIRNGREEPARNAQAAHAPQ